MRMQLLSLLDPVEAGTRLWKRQLARKAEIENRDPILPAPPLYFTLSLALIYFRPQNCPYCPVKMCFLQIEVTSYTCGYHPETEERGTENLPSEQEAKTGPFVEYPYGETRAPQGQGNSDAKEKESSKAAASGEKFNTQVTELGPTSSDEELEETATVQVGTSTVWNKAKREPASGNGGWAAEYEHYYGTKEINEGTEKTPTDLDVAYRSQKRTPVRRLGWNRVGWRNLAPSSTEKVVNLNRTTPRSKIGAPALPNPGTGPSPPNSTRG